MGRCQEQNPNAYDMEQQRKKTLKDLSMIIAIIPVSSASPPSAAFAAHNHDPESTTENYYSKWEEDNQCNQIISQSYI